eukprot:TRINITY_DN7286_c0_g1_i1.p1 TRINITY_DN7286_c0_g1~~TRINITY_DN7286_c0_g1_i1.p1  ORF type:complete len:280 (-),score=45.27 TRINITY_DN7286_c0_g1_i1:49-888(-)
MKFPLVILASCLAALALETPPRIFAPKPDYDRQPLPAPKSNLTWVHYQQEFTVKTRRVTAFVAVLDDPRYFAFLPPQFGCSGDRIATSKTAKANGCRYATNAGFFSFSAPHCIGDLISDGKAITSQTSVDLCLGITAQDLRIGFMGEADRQAGFTQLINAHGWLVRDGRAYTAHSADLNVSSAFVTELAPRSTVGTFANGSLVLVQVDGIEKKKEGINLLELGDLLQQLGVYSAINLDGGGSSVSVLDGAVIDKPTCDDTGTVCERNVTSITCFRNTRG